MPHGYCTECQAQVTVRDGQCLLDHPVDPSTIEETSGRRLRTSARRRRGTHTVHREDTVVPPPPTHVGGSVALLERTEFVIDPPRLPPDAPTDVPTRPEALYRPVTDTDTLSLTGLLVEELWNLSPDDDIEGWTPGEMDPTLIRSGVRMRKVVAIGALMLLTLAIGWRVLTWGDGQTTESLAAVSDGSITVAANVAALDPVVDDIADGTLSDPLAASSALGRLDESARTLFSAAGDLPTDEGLAQVREQTIGQAAGALELATVLSESIAYSAAVELITRPVELPAETDIDGLTDVTERVTGWVGNFVNGVATLPGNDLTDTHRAALRDLASSLPEWQAAYLDALRARDAERAAEHAAQLETQTTFVRNSWAGVAAGIAEWANERIAALGEPIEVNR
ncbi:MAG TPA: hypothetical protein VLB67_01050 [Acidimicrobiia bacterium]|nr:hypothetical protein [Acidimicrobiia bacterium]